MPSMSIKAMKVPDGKTVSLNTSRAQVMNVFTPTITVMIRGTFSQLAVRSRYLALGK